jgi:hypothetical protein
VSHAKERAIDSIVRHQREQTAAEIAAAIEMASTMPAEFCACGSCYSCGYRNATVAAAKVARQAGAA